MSLLSDKTVPQLKKFAMELGVPFKSKVRKADLIAAIEAQWPDEAEPSPTIGSHTMACSNLEIPEGTVIDPLGRKQPEKESEEVESTAAPDPQIGAKRLSNLIWAKHKAKARAKRKQQQASRRRNRR
jgi:hypothetical protein